MSGDESVRLLLIEDSSTWAQAVEMALSERMAVGYSLDAVQDLASGCDWLARQQFDLILLDLNLPDSDGIETFFHVREKAGDASILVLSAESDEALALTAVRHGAQDYLVKDRADAESLGRAVRFALERTKHLRAERALRAELERSRNELDRYAAELERSNQALDEFAYAASHDLRERLRSIFSASSFLIDDYADTLDAAFRSRLVRLQELVQHMDDLIKSLLQYARVGRTPFHPVETNMNEMLAAVVDSLHGTLEAHCAEVRVPQPLPTVCCDRVLTPQLFQNLIANGVKYNDQPTKWVEVGFCRSADDGSGTCGAPDLVSPAASVFFVRDNGIGMRPEHLDLIFRAFERLHGRDEYGGGSGLGVAIVKMIVQQHGGQVWVASQVGAGSTFYFTLEGQQHGTSSTTDLRGRR